MQIKSGEERETQATGIKSQAGLIGRSLRVDTGLSCSPKTDAWKYIHKMFALP